MSEKKSKKLNFEDQIDMFRNAGVELLKIDLDQSLEEQGPFDMILHKFTDIIVKAQQGNITAQRIIRSIEDYFESHPECIIVDPLEGIRKLLDRHEQYNLVLDCNGVNTESYMFIPTFVYLTSKDIDENQKKLLDANVQYPFVCKPIVAHGTKICHKMAVIFNEDGLKDIQPPCVAQTFVNHNATLYKLYKIGSKQYVCQRPSLKNLYAGDHPTIFFDTHDVSKSDSSHHLTELDDEELGASPLKPDISKLDYVGETLRHKLNLDLFGVDVIIECDTQRYAVIDINVFPSYDEVDNFFGDLLDHMLYLMNTQLQKHSILGPTHHQGGPAHHQGGHAILKHTGRTISLPESNTADHASCKRLKTLDQAHDKQCTCDGLGNTRGLCHIDPCYELNQGSIMTAEERRNQRNSAGSTSNRITEDL